MIELATRFFLLAGILSVLIATGQGHYRAGVRFGMELWTAAGLLKLSQNMHWNELLVAALVIGLRNLLNLSLHSRSRHGPVDVDS